MEFPFRKRRRRLIKAGLQLRLVGAFGGLVALALLLQFMILSWFVTRAASGIEGAGGELAEHVPGMMLTVLGTSLVVLLPPFLVVGTLITFRIAGPVYRFEQYLRGIAEGTQIGPCKIRNYDELQTLCDAINVATEPLRRRHPAAKEEEHAEELEPSQASA